MSATGVLTGASLDISGDVDIDGTTNLDVVDIDGAVDMASTLAVAGVLTGASLDISGDIDVDGTTNLDVVDIDGAVDMASTLQVDGALTVATFGDTARAANFHGGSILLDGGAASEIIIGDGNVAYMSIQTTDDATAMNIRNFSGSSDLVTIERASGNVGIGTASPNVGGGTGLHIHNSSSSRVHFTNDTTGTAATDGTELLTSGADFYIDQQESGKIVFYQNGSQSAFFDASRNFLVATTDTTLYNNTTGGGFSVSSSGFTQIAKQGADAADPVLILNQTGADGEILRFYKDGTAVGSIGVTSGSFAVGQSNTGIGFYNSDNIAFPATAAGAVRDNAIDLGYAAGRFKDLYLSGGAYIGGTAAANKLDDYEEGTFTATLKGGGAEPGTLISDAGATYTKIGRTVSITIGFENVNTTGYSGEIFVNGLPFASIGDRTVTNVATYGGATWTGGQIVGIIEGGYSQIDIKQIESNSGWASATHNAGAGRYFWFTATYETNT